MRDLMVLLAMLMLVPLALRNAYGAYLLWGWAGLIAVHTFLYGFMRSVQYVQLFAILALILVLLGRDADKRKFEFNGAILLFLVYGVHAVLSATLAYPGVDRNWELCIDLLKTLLFCALMPILVTSRFRIHAMVVMIGLAAGFHGLIEGLKFVASGAAHLSQGNAKLGDRNHFAVLVAMGIPLLVYLFQYANNRLARIGYVAVIAVNILGVMSTQSRAGMVTVAALGVWYAVFSRRKILSFMAIIVVVVGVLAVAPDSWTNRMQTMKSVESVEDDASFMGRVMAWKRGSAIAVANPVFGGGFHSVQAASIFDEFRAKQGILGFIDTPLQTYPAAAHSIYFEVLGDMGFVGLLWFLLLLASPFVHRRAILRMAKTRPVELDWARDLAQALAACMLAYAVGGASISAAYFELPYILIMLMWVLRQQVVATVVQGRTSSAGAVVRTVST